MPDPSFARYQRQMILPGFGEAAQWRLAAAHAVLVGCGALGTAAADLLARAGVGTLTIIDRDVVELTNLQRQTLFTEADAEQGLPKAVAAANRLGAVNSSVRLHPVVADVNPRSVEALVRGAGVVMDGTDNFRTRYLLNDACVKHGVPLVYGGVVGTAGLNLTVLPRDPSDAAGRATPCLRCVFPEPPPPGTAPTCDTAGVLGPVAALVAAMQAAEALKILSGHAAQVSRALVQTDLWNNVRRALSLPERPSAECPCCGEGRFDFLNAEAEAVGVICGADSVQVLPGVDARLDLAALASRLSSHGEFALGDHLLRVRLREREGVRLTVFRDGRAIVHGIAEPALARSIYDRFIGS